MDRGTYAAASGGMAQLRLLDIIANNLANVNSVGFKQGMLTTVTQPFAETLASQVANYDPYAFGDHARTPGAFSAQGDIDFSVGAFRQTGGPLDVALRNANDFFVVQGQTGLELTRAGNFTLDSQQRLVTMDGFPVSGAGGPINVQGTGASISPSGAVRAGGALVGQLQVVRVDNTQQLERVGATRFRLPDNGTGVATIPDLATGSLEQANISMSSAMVDMISAHRGFQAYTKVATTIDEMNRDATSRLVAPR